MSGGEVIGQFERKEYKKWVLNYTPIAGKEYKLVVKVKDFPDITAVTRMPEQAKVAKILNIGDYNIRYFSQRGAHAPYWIFHLYQKYARFDLTPFVTDEDVLVEEIGTTHPGVDDFNALDEVMFSGTGISGQTRSHVGYLRIVPDGDIDRFAVEGHFGQTLVVFRFVSEEYDKYLRSSLLKMMSHIDKTDPTRWFDEYTVFGNVENGLGIFGAFSDQICQINPITDAVEAQK